MKIWNGYASEHSAKLVMIGRFKEFKDVDEANELLDKLRDVVQGDPDTYELEPEPKDRRYNREMFELLCQLNFYPSPMDLTQFLLDVDVDVNRINKTITVTTDEDDVSVFMKALIRHGARIEIYSRHSYSNTEESG